MLRIIAMLLVVVGTLCVSLGVTAFWIDRTIFDPDRLASLSGELLDREEVRTALTEATVDAALEDAPRLVQLTRPLLRQVVRGVVGSQEFAALMSSSVRATAVAALETDAPEIFLRLPDVLIRVREGVATLDPDLAAQLPGGPDVESTVIATGGTAKAIRRASTTLEPLSRVLLIVGAALSVSGVLLTDRRRAVGMLAGILLAAWTSAIALALLLSKAVVTQPLGDPIDRAAAEAAWEVLIEGVHTTMLVVALAGVAIVGLVWLFGSERWERSLGRVLPRVVGILVAVVGVVLVVRPHRGFDLLAVALGCVLMVVGFSWSFLELWRDPRIPAPESSGTTDVWR